MHADALCHKLLLDVVLTHAYKSGWWIDFRVPIVPAPTSSPPRDPEDVSRKNAGVYEEKYSRGDKFWRYIYSRSFGHCGL